MTPPIIAARIVPEARIEPTDAGLAYVPPGWFVINAREARWRHRAGGEPSGLYHWKNDQEDFLVLVGEPLFVIEGQERQLRPWDFVHCPPGTRHTFAGAGHGPSVILAVGSREHIDENCHGGAYVADEVARRHGASVDEDTTDASDTYASFGPTGPARYQDGWLPG